MYGLVRCKKYETQPALLKDYSRRHVKERTYPGITKLGKS
jgi:hypothetical protein